MTKVLGIFIDKDLNWKHHINTVRTKKILSKLAASIYKASCLINLDGMYILYCSLLLPYINYCSEMWGNTHAANIKCIAVLQKRIVRLFFGAKRLYHNSILFKNCSFIICKHG